MATTRAVRLLITAVAVVGVVAVAGLLAGLRVIAGNPAPTSTTTSSTTPVTVNAVSASPNTVTVVGSGQVNAAPDEALLSLGVSATLPTAKAALNAAAAEMTHLTAALSSQGVAAQDMQTSSVSLGQTTTCCPNQITGYTGSNSVTVTIHHLTNVGSIEVAAVAAVGNDIQLNGVSLTLSDDSSQLRVARIAAMADARSRASQWAAQTGRKLGPILAVSEIVDSQSSGSACNSGCGGGGGGVPIEAAQNTVSVNITVEFQLE
jgi:uncharacterized protein YggE